MKLSAELKRGVACNLGRPVHVVCQARLRDAILLLLLSGLGHRRVSFSCFVLVVDTQYTLGSLHVDGCM
jgi:hypothetical protein